MEEFQNNSPESMDDGDNHEGKESSGSDADEEFDMYGRYQVKTVAHQNKYNKHIVKLEKVVSIEKIIKECALHFLPAKSLFRFKTVCKNWGQWIEIPLLSHRQSYSFGSISGLFCQSSNEYLSFISLNPKAYGIPDPSLKFLPESVHILSTCNGLLCCRGCNEDNKYYICNPATKEWKKLPQPSLYHGYEPAIVLAFEPSQNNFRVDYDLICAVPSLDLPVTQFEIYSSAEGCWKVSQVICCDEDALELKSTGRFYMKGIAYWETSSGNKALVFDLKVGQCGIQPLPFYNEMGGVLTEIRGELGYVLAHNQDNACQIEIYGGTDMTVLKNRILLNPLASSLGENIFGECRALPCLNSDLLIILVGRTIYSYDVRDRRLERLSVLDRDFTRYFPYVNSLVSLATDKGKTIGKGIPQEASTGVATDCN